MDEDAPGSAQDFSKQKRLVLCFDGTGNRFTGTDTDTNIVKIYKMLDRKVENQYHYYQPGIGTYVEGSSTSWTPLSRLWSNFAMGLDQAVGTSFEHHVTAGYRFIMRYFSPGDCIYVFGFSRGAYTARFLSEMIHEVGLLSQGNDEMVRFAWKLFSDYQNSAKDESSKEFVARRDLMKDFKETFCRSGVNVHFLGLFDCVNSVGQFELPLFRSTPTYLPTPPATHIRHAVALHERRVKFKPALFSGFVARTCDLKEVWFAGDHCDVGGGYGRLPSQKKLLSDEALAWMLDELKNLPDTENKLAFEPYNPPREKELRQGVGSALDIRIALRPHDSLRLPALALITIFWWFLEIIPLSSRLELENGKWIPRYWPPNMGGKRSVPHDANIHRSVDILRQNGVLGADDMPKLGGPSPTLTLTPFIKGKFIEAMQDAKRKGANALANLPSETAKSHEKLHTPSVVPNGKPHHT
ncbi:hypothetical protein TWF281_011021 [Arthrobotrys megalospora]